MARKTKYDFYGDYFKATAVELGALPKLRTSCYALVQNNWQPGHWGKCLNTAKHMLQR